MCEADFYAKTQIEVGVELTLDYGAGYWLGAEQPPAPGTDSRDFNLDRVESFMDWCREEQINENFDQPGPNS